MACNAHRNDRMRLQPPKQLSTALPTIVLIQTGCIALDEAPRAPVGSALRYRFSDIRHAVTCSLRHGPGSRALSRTEPQPRPTRRGANANPCFICIAKSSNASLTQTVSVLACNASCSCCLLCSVRAWDLAWRGGCCCMFRFRHMHFRCCWWSSFRTRCDSSLMDVQVRVWEMLLSRVVNRDCDQSCAGVR